MTICECEGRECGVFYWTCGCCDVGGYEPEPPLTPEEARVIIDAGYDPERILAFLFGEADG